MNDMDIPQGVAADAGDSPTPHPEKAKKAKDPKTRRTLIGVGVAGGGLLLLTVAALVVGSLPVGVVNNGPSWARTSPGFYGSSANLIVPPSGSQLSYFTLLKSGDSPAVYGITAMAAPAGAVTLVLPSAYAPEGEAAAAVVSLGDAPTGASLLGASPGAASLQAVYAPAYYAAIGREALAHLPALTTLSMASDANRSLTVGDKALAEDPQLQNVIFPTGLVSLGEGAFAGDAALASLALGATTLTRLGANAFQGCAALASVRLPASLRAIGAAAFAATPLTEVSYGGTKAAWGNLALDPAWRQDSALLTVACQDGTLTLP